MFTQHHNSNELEINKLRLFSMKAAKALITPFLLFLIYLLIVFRGLIPLLEESFLLQKKEMCMRTTEVIISSLMTRQKDIEEGKISSDDAKRKAIERMRPLRFGPTNKDYFWIIGPNSRFIMHPYRPDFENADPSKVIGPDGNNLDKLIEAMFKITRQPEGGFLEYMWHRKDALSQIARKLSYVKLFPEWNWIVGTGLYLDELEEELSQWRWRLMLIGLFLVILASIISLYLAFRAAGYEIRDSQITSRLMANELKYRMLVENTQDIPYVVNCLGILTFIGPQILRFGFNAEEMIGKSFLEFILPDDCADVLSKFRFAISTGEPMGSIFRARATDESPIFWFDEKGMVTRDSNGKITGLTGILRDVTDKKLAEESLLKSSENLRITLQSIGDAVIATDCSGTIQIMNPVAESLTGWSANDGISRNLKEVFIIKSSKTGQTGINPVEMVMKTGQTVGMANHTILVSRDGTERQIADSGAPIKDKSGNITGVVLVFRDVTEEYLLQDELRDHEEQFRSIFETSPYAISINDTETLSYKMVNRAFEEITGWPQPDVLNKTPMEMGIFNSSPATDKLIDTIRNTGTIRSELLEAKSRDGQKREILLSASCINFSGSRCILSTFIDVTESRRLEEQLRQTKKMDVIGQLAGGIAHDFNNMLAAILGNAELLSMDIPEDSPDRPLIETIMDGSKRAAELTQKLLAFSRKGKVVSIPMDVRESIKSAIALLERSIDRRITIITRFDTDSPKILGDPTLLQNAFLNLAINARDAMPDGGVLTFAVSDTLLDNDFCRNHPLSLISGRYVEINISDTGVGMTQEIREKIFEPFFTTKAAGKGTGLGLAAVYGTIKEHRGAVNVYSEVGMGTIFKIYLPILSGDTISDNFTMEENIIPGSGTILVVDDEALIRSTAQTILLSLGYKVVIAEDGQNALEVFAEHKDKINAVLLDMVMPRLNGRQTLIKLREMDPSIKIVISSGFNPEGTMTDLLEMGDVGFIQKPYRISSLSQAIHKIMKQET
ncbi:MAG: hypothetical protein CVV64_10200 [Candidatus Wallbacteria bacterium HGW-Wallbacteria-1]|jgi:PAS domain S-box-containing protein|uniref:histidine kinase n=1 Tax=Candidatus Wallbacteria bacterium HGW-Wallbacteria-1 TaxID=2013854 RepID=A0A2N1PPR2_9BACT|nr:MAG: hypothetical protein CVV64_10200 [Candidatus Wallbacteria bacterium HGW-Wallbacteria-1]